MAGIPRHLLPQIAQKDIPAFRKYLRTNGISSVHTTRQLSTLKPIQDAVNQDKIDAIKGNLSVLEMPLLTTTDGYVVDGHHRWLAGKDIGKETLPVIECDCDLKSFLKIAHQYSKSFTKSVHEIIEEEIQTLVRVHGR